MIGVDGAPSVLICTGQQCPLVEVWASALPVFFVGARIGLFDEVEEELPLDVGDTWKTIVEVPVVDSSTLRSAAHFERPEVHDGQTVLAGTAVHFEGVLWPLVAVAEWVVLGHAGEAARSWRYERQPPGAGFFEFIEEFYCWATKHVGVRQWSFIARCHSIGKKDLFGRNVLKQLFHFH